MTESSKQVFSSDLVKYIIARTAGTHTNDEIFDDARPSRKFIIGTLAAPRKRICYPMIVRGIVLRFEHSD